MHTLGRYRCQFRPEPQNQVYLGLICILTPTQKFEKIAQGLEIGIQRHSAYESFYELCTAKTSEHF